jgi:pimeloyl-ACP methyl ester carboxylesterase
MPNALPPAKRRRGMGCLRTIAIAFAVVLAALVLFVVWWAFSTNRAIAQVEAYAYSEGATGRYVTIDGRRFHYIDTGPSPSNPTATPLLLVHGFNANAGNEWAEITPFLTNERRVIIPDLIGFGHSERASESGPWYTDAGRAAALAELLNALEIPQADVMAASFGGDAALNMALDYPERVRRLILSGADVYTQGGGFFERAGNLPLGIGRANTFSALGAGGRGNALFALGCRFDGYCPSAETIARRERLAQISGTTDAFVAMAQTPDVTRIPDELGNVTQPTLVLWGANDLQGQAIGNQLAAAIPGAQFALVDGSDHTPHLTVPDETARRVLAFTE